MNFIAIFKRRVRSRLRTCIRGYNYLKRNRAFSLVRYIYNDFSSCEFSAIGVNISAHIFGAGASKAEYVVRQYLLEKLHCRPFNLCLLRAIGSRSPIAYPLPPEWRTVLLNNDIQINVVLSAILWWVFLFKQFLKGLFVLVYVLLKSLIYSVCSFSPTATYAYFYGLKYANVSCQAANETSYNILGWYANWSGRISNIIAHTVSVPQLQTPSTNIIFSPEPYLLLRNVLELSNLFVSVVFAGIDAFWGLIFGQWWNTLLFAESVMAHAVRICPSERLPKDCLFHWSGNIYKPLWAYELESKGCRIVSYFYSTCDQPKLPGLAYESMQGVWGPSTWPLFLVWDKYQDELLRRDIPFAFQSIITGPIPFSNEEALFIPSNQTCVAVFDIEFFRLSSHFAFSTLADYFSSNPNLSSLFLNQIQQALADSGLIMAFKKKREEGNRSQKIYRKLLDELSQMSNVVMIPSGVSAMQLVGQCSAVISMPFTSTALLLREQNIPSIYYDPTGWIQRDDRAAHGIPVLIGANELRLWIANLLTNNS